MTAWPSSLPIPERIAACDAAAEHLRASGSPIAAAAVEALARAYRNAMESAR